MLTLVIEGEEYWDDELEEFIYPASFTLEMEHSLVSLSKWESIWEKPFLGPEKKTDEEAMSYIKIMTLTPDVPPEIYSKLTNHHANQINAYLEAKMTATWFKELPNKGRRGKEIITAELLYYWMITCNIPLECESWHLNRLFTLIKVCNEKNSPPKKMNTQEALTDRARINAERKAKMKQQG